MTKDATKAADSGEIPLVLNPSAPTILVDGYAGFSITGGVARFGMYAVEFDPVEGKTQRRIVMNLAASIATVDAIQKALSSLMEDLKRNGTVRTAPIEIAETEPGSRLN